MNTAFDNQTLMFMMDSVMDSIQGKEQENIDISNDISELSKNNDHSDINDLKTLKWNNMKYINTGKNLISCIQKKIMNPNVDEKEIFRYIIKLEELQM
jgi:hypothetical protein